MCLDLMSHKIMSPLASFFFSVWEDVSPIDYFSTGISSLIFFFLMGTAVVMINGNFWKVSREYGIIWTWNI